jgi:hypothetical protein
MQQLRSLVPSVQAEPVELQHLLLQNHLTMIHGLQQQRHQPVVDGEHLQPTNHLFNK